MVELSRSTERREKDRVRATGATAFPRFGALVGAIERFANDLATIRVAAIITGYEDDNAGKKKARGSAARLIDTIDECRAEVGAKVPPLALILDEIANNVRPLAAARLHSPAGQEAQYALARFYLDLGRYPEAAVVVREARLNLYASDEGGVEVNSSTFAREKRLAAERAFWEQDRHGAETFGDIRNDIEHGGFRQRPGPARLLQDRIRKLVGQVQTVVPPASAAGRTFFVSRHPGAIDWAKARGIGVDRPVKHLDLNEIQPGDAVIGTLPVNLAAAVCAKRARYLHLSLELPEDRRGMELSAADMDRFGARIVEYEIRELPSAAGPA
jgi:CRISPR-associated protein Csx16